MNNAIQQQVFNNLMESLNIEPSKETLKIKKFYEWMKKVKNVYVDNPVAMSTAYVKILKN